MDFKDIIGQDFLKKYFQKIIENDKIPHTQLFVGKEGSGTLSMALAFAQKLLCSDNLNCINKVRKLIHPDLHFVFPTVTTERIKKPDSDSFLNEWRSFVTTQSYGSLYDWMKHLEVANKQGIIRVADAENVIKKVAVKPYEADYKVFIIWQVEKMNNETANKLLKILEEPPEDTKFILISESTEEILPTILSRCQVHHFNPIPVAQIKQKLIEKFDLNQEDALKIAHQANGNWNKALQLAQSENSDNDFQKLFIDWVRIAFSAKNNKQSIRKLINWAEQMSGLGRETQKQFLEFAMESFRQALLINYQNPDLSYYDFSVNNFDLNKFAPFVHSANIEDIYQKITESIYHIERNANPKIIFLDLSINLTKLIHKTEKFV